MLGVPRSRLRSMRGEALEEGFHWRKEEGAVAYTAGGLERVRELLGLSAEESPEKKNGGGNGAVAGPVRLRVYRTCRNRRVVVCFPIEGEEKVHCQVRDSGNLAHGMELGPCLPVEHGPPGWFRFRGVLPNRPGRWGEGLRRRNEQIFRELEVAAGENKSNTEQA